MGEFSSAISKLSPLFLAFLKQGLGEDVCSSWCFGAESFYLSHFHIFFFFPTVSFFPLFSISFSWLSEKLPQLYFLYLLVSISFLLLCH